MNCKCEVVDMIKQLQSDKDALLKERDELKKKLDEKSRLVDIYGARLDTKDVMLKKLNETNEDLANKLAEERARVDDKTHELSLYKRELENRDNHINELYARNNNLKEQIKNLRAEKDAMAAGKAKALDEAETKIENLQTKFNSVLRQLDNATRNYDNLLDKNKKLHEAYADLERCNNTQAESIKDLLESNDKMKENIESKAKCILELCARIEKRDEFKTVLPGMDVASLYPTGMYIEQDIEATYRIAEKLNACGNSYIVSANGLCHAIARTMYNKYDALVKAGFSHDDAMSLIPMWTD